MRDSLLEFATPRLASVPGVIAVVLGGSRARGTATDSSDYDLGLYFSADAPLDTDRLGEVVEGIVDAGSAAAVTRVGGWGPWIVGGGWLSARGRKVDILYRDADAVARVIQDCRDGQIVMNYQPGHPHGFCSAIWMGEIALCQPIHDPVGTIAKLKALTVPYPDPLRLALMARFRWEVTFSIENGEIAVPRGDQTHIAGCVHRALCCLGQVLFALNSRYLINEKGALDEAASFPITIPGLRDRVADIWRRLGRGDPLQALREIRALDEALTVAAAKIQ